MEFLEKNFFSNNSFYKDSRFLLEIISRDNIYNYLMSQIMKKDNLLVLGVKDTEKVYKLPINILLKNMTKYLDNNIINDIQKSRIEKLINGISFDNFIKKDLNEIIKYDIDGKIKEISKEEIISILLMPDNKYRQLVLKEKYNDNISMKEYMYIVYWYVIDQVETKFELPIDVLNRIMSIKKMEYVDFEALNFNNMTNKNSYLKDILIDNELLESLTTSLPNDILDKALLIYFRLCNLFIYDEEFFASNRNYSTIDHTEPKNISLVNLNNTTGVCYEFIAIYAKALEKLNIEFNVLKSIGEYGDGHHSLRFRYKDFIVSADGIKTIVYSDLFNIRFGQFPKGIECINSNKATRNEFNKRLIDFRKKYITNIDDKYIETIKNETKDFNINQKINYILEKLRNNINMCDMVSLIILLYNNIFTKDEKNDVLLNVVGLKEETSIKKILIILQDKLNEFCYTIYNSKQEVISLNELYKMYENDKISAIETLPIDIFANKEVFSIDTIKKRN